MYAIPLYFYVHVVFLLFFFLNKALTLLQVDLIIHPAGKTHISAGVCENLASRSCFYSCFTLPGG